MIEKVKQRILFVISPLSCFFISVMSQCVGFRSIRPYNLGLCIILTFVIFYFAIDAPLGTYSNISHHTEQVFKIQHTFLSCKDQLFAQIDCEKLLKRNQTGMCCLWNDIVGEVVHEKRHYASYQVQLWNFDPWNETLNYNFPVRQPNETETEYHTMTLHKYFKRKNWRANHDLPYFISLFVFGCVGCVHMLVYHHRYVEQVFLGYLICGMFCGALLSICYVNPVMW